MTMTYRREFDINRYDFASDLAFGEAAEASVKQFLECVLRGTVEVKADRYRNGRMVVETHQHRRKPDRSGADGTFWYPSGINVTNADWWVYNYSPEESFVVVSVPRLRRFLRANKDKYNNDTKRTFAESSDNPSKGWLIMPNEVMDLLINPDYDDWTP